MMPDPGICLKGEVPGNALSFSKIRVFMTCGYKFYLQYVKKLHSAPTAGMMLGRSFHKGQEYGLKQMIEHATPLGSAVRDFAVADFEAEIKTESEVEFGEKDPNASVVKDDLAKMSAPVFDKSISKLDPISAEETFEVDIAGVLVRGRLDIKDKQDDGVNITELKTGTRNPELLGSFDWQQSLYQYSQKMVRGLRKIFAKRHQDIARNFSLTIYEKKPDPPSLISDMIIGIGRIAEAVKAASIHGFIKTSDLKICSWCGFRRLCRPEIFSHKDDAEKYLTATVIYTSKKEKNVK